ncbi:MAG: GNAT family N-acetyltransferase [Acidobacteriales bacterium]|nr:GNAT family N-acetyltransferase [Terriglobales bacterium]
MSLTVLSVSYPLARVSSSTAGGAEQILACLDRALVASGHTSLVIAPEGSDCAGTLIATPAIQKNLDEAAKASAWHAIREAIRSAICKYPVDVIHLHGIDFHEYLPSTNLPVVVTVHLPPGWYAEGALDSRPNTSFICVSHAQQRSSPVLQKMAQVIENGVDLACFDFRDSKQDYVLAMGRICPEKGFHLAMDAAKRSGLPLYLAGELYDYPSHREYFESEIVPRLNGRHKFLGAVGGDRKRDLLAGARCVVISSSAPETSSLVCMEALASGTPVVAFPVGALPELVDHGRTGFLVEGVAAMSAAIRDAAQLDPRACRREAEQRFSHTRMCNQYFDLYQTMRDYPQKTRSSSVRANTRQATLSVRILNQITDLEPLLEDWEHLRSCCPQATTFQRPEWLWPYMKFFPPSEPFLLEFRRGEKLVGLAPFLIYQQEGMRVLGLIGGGLSDYLDILVHPHHQQDVLRSLAVQLERCADKWDRIEFTDLPPHSPLLKLDQFMKADIGGHDICPVLELPRELSALGATVPAHKLRNLRNARRRLAREGSGSVDLATPQNAPAFLETMIQLHSTRWSTEGNPGVFADPMVRAFHRAVVPALAEAGVLRLYLLHLNGDPIASLYALFEAEVAYCYLQGYDPDHRVLSPGTHILGAGIEDAIREGKHRLDMLRGQEAYKYAWGAKDQSTLRLQISQPAARSRPRAA